MTWKMCASIGFVLMLAMAGSASAQFIRGDANLDGAVDVSDGIQVAGGLFEIGMAVLPDLVAGDANDNGLVEIGDAIYLFRYALSGGSPPPPPFPSPGMDTTPATFPTAPTTDIEFALGTGSGCSGGDAILPMFVSSSLPIQGFAVRVPIPSELDFLDAMSGPLDSLVGDPADFFDAKQVAGPAVRVGCIIGLIREASLSPGDDLEVVHFRFAVDGSVPMGASIPLFFEDAPSFTPPFYNLAVVDRIPHRPQLVSGEIVTDCASVDFRRGDTNEDGIVSLSDSVFLVNYLFLGGPESGCQRTGDINADFILDVADVVGGLNYTILGMGMIPAPYPNCGPATAGFVSCDSYGGGCP